MKEKELDYYYPYKADKIHNYRTLQNRINSENYYDFEEDPFYAFIDRISDGIDAVGGYYSNDFSNWSLWNRLGRNIFSFSSDLLLMLEKTDVDNISYDMFSLPYDNFYLSFRGLDLHEDSELKNNIDGVYVHLERSEMQVIPKSQRDPDMDDEYYDPEYKLLIYFHFAGDFDETVKVKHADLVFNEDILMSWSYALSFPADEDYITVGDAIQQEIKKFERQLLINFPTNVEKQRRLFDYYKSFVDKTVRVLVNSLLYLSQPREKLPVTTDYPDNLPHNFNRKLNSAKTTKEKRKIAKKISETGFSKILFLGNNEQSNKNEYTDYQRKSMHWRRGHWRKQPYSDSLEKNRMIWIRPVLVNKADDDSLPKGHVYDVRNN